MKPKTVKVRFEGAGRVWEYRGDTPAQKPAGGRSRNRYMRPLGSFRPGDKVLIECGGHPDRFLLAEVLGDEEVYLA